MWSGRRPSGRVSSAAHCRPTSRCRCKTRRGSGEARSASRSCWSATHRHRPPLRPRRSRRYAGAGSTRCVWTDLAVVRRRRTVVGRGDRRPRRGAGAAAGVRLGADPGRATSAGAAAAAARPARRPGLGPPRRRHVRPPRRGTPPPRAGRHPGRRGGVLDRPRRPPRVRLLRDRSRPGDRRARRTIPATRAGSAYAAASVSTVSCALRPLGLGTTQTGAGPIPSGWRPTVARGRRNADRYAVTPRTATTRGRTLSTARPGLAPSRSSSASSSSARAVARRTRLVMPIPRPTSDDLTSSVMGPSCRPARRGFRPATMPGRTG